MVGGRPKHSGWLQEGVIRGSMLGKTILPTDEELGKKDDDHKPGASGRVPLWNFTKTPLRWRRRRILLTLVGLYIVYWLFNNMPDWATLNGTTTSIRRPIVPMTNEDHTQAYNEEPAGPPPGLKAPKDGSPPPREYAGQIRFYRLAESLHGAAHTNGYRPINRNVLFAISNLKSASTLLPMICEMSKWSRNYVHAAFMGREDIPVGALLEINGIDKEKCPAIWHDARPDYTEYSSDERAESSVMAAMMHIQSYLHPQVTIIDDHVSEDAFFSKGIRAKTKMLEIPVIEIPKDRCESFMWITRLDTGSLRSWHKPTVDILIQAPSESSGGLLRLLKSLKEADYNGLKFPRLTIELPTDTDDWVSQYLGGFVWPPGNDDPLAPSQITIRRRIASQRATQEDSSIRFLELFYPSSTTNSHVLLLSPDAQLSPLYYHYLKYVLLDYKYSSYGEDDSINVMGVSLELPSLLLDGKTKLSPPKPADMHTTRYKDLFPDIQSAQFLWQAPNSHASLFFGDKWAELHSFLSNRIVKQHQAPKMATRPKLVSETLPAWTEYMLEFMRARGYSLFYPVTSASDSFVTIHNELYHAPEEFAPQPSTDPEKDIDEPPKLPDEPFLRADIHPPKPTNPELPVIPYSRPLHLALPFEGDLPEIPHLPYLLYNGEIVQPTNVSTIALAFANQFRENVGGCRIPEGKHRKVVLGTTKDLFCFGDEDEDDWEDNVNAKFEAEVVDGYQSDDATSETLMLTSTVRERIVSATAVPNEN